MALANKYEKACSVCNTLVIVGAGYVKRDNNDKWQTFCAPCSGVVVDAKPTIAVSISDGLVKFAPTTHLGPDLFTTFKAAVEGAKWSKEHGNRSTVAMAGKLVARLHAAGFVVDMTDDARSAIEANEASAKAALVATDNRLAEIDAVLALRGQSLFSWQRAGIPWLSSRDRALLSDDMGLGKTLQTLLALPSGAPILVVCPAVAKGVWKREVGKWRPEINVTVLEGEGSYRLPVAGEMVVMNSDILPEDPTMETVVVAQPSARTNAGDGGVESINLQPGDKVWIEADGMAIDLVCSIHTADGRVIDIRENTQAIPLHCDPSMGGSTLVWSTSRHRAITVWHHRHATVTAGLCVVADEAHAYKGGVKTQRGQRMRALCNLAAKAGGKQYGLTGTPLLNTPAELYKVLECFNLAQEAFGDWYGFTRCFQAYRDRWGGWHYGEPLPEVGERLARVMLRRTKGDVLKDLPPKRWESLTVDLDEGTRALCDDIDVSAVCEAIREGRAVRFKTIAKAREALAKAKTPMMLELVKEHEENGTPLLVFSAHTYPIKQLGKRKGWAIITGDTLPEDRTRIENAFQAGELLGVGLTIDAGGVAITLTRASHEIFVDRDWTPALNAQAEDRAHRIGQKNAVLITTLVADHPLDERVNELLIAKQNMVNASVEMARTTTAQAPELTTVDFASITAEAATEQARKDAAMELAETRAAQIAAAEQARPMVKAHDGTMRKEPRVAERYLAITAQEAWACAALNTLAGLDPDGARVPNSVGFNGGDSSLGRVLASRAVNVGLTNSEWQYAMKMCRKYHRQVGHCPE